MASETKSALVVADAAATARVRSALASRGIAATPVVDVAAAFVNAAAARVHLAVVAISPSASETCRALRELSIPVILLTSSANVLEVNSLRKAANATLALPGTASDADLTTAAGNLVAAPTNAAAKTPMPQPPLTGIERDPAFALATACRERWNGILRFGERSLLLLEGEPIASGSNFPGDRLGEILVKKKRATPGQVERALRFAQSKSGKLGASLIDMSVITAAELESTLAEQAYLRAIALFGPFTGASRFTAQKTIRDDERRMRGISGPRLVADGIRRMYDGKRLKALIPDAGVFRLTPGAAARLPDFQFTPVEAASLALLDGTRTVSECAVRSSPLDFLHALFAGICMDLIRSASVL